MFQHLIQLSVKRLKTAFNRLTGFSQAGALHPVKRLNTYGFNRVTGGRSARLSRGF